MKKFKNKISDIITIVLFVALIAGFSVTFAVLPDGESSAVEGRSLQQLPSFSEGTMDGSGTEYKGADYLIHGKLADAFDEYFCDQFPLRNMFLSLSSYTQLAFGRGVNNGVLYKNGDLAVTRFDAVGFDTATEYFDEKHVKSSIQNLNSVCEGLDIPISVILPPRSIDVKADSLGYPTEGSDALNALIKENISGDYYIDLLGTMRALYKTGEQPYFKTDHHWTVKGAYYAYAALMESWGVEPYAMEDFSFETVTEDFKGTSLRNGNYFFMDGETLQIARYPGDEQLVVSNLNLGFAVTEGLAGMYDFAAAEGEDAYSVFLYGKPAHMSISKPDEDREILLVMKDSFAHSLVPFLTRHYNIVIVDMDTSRWGTSLSTVISMVRPARVLMVYNLENLIETDKLKNIK